MSERSMGEGSGVSERPVPVLSSSPHAEPLTLDFGGSFVGKDKWSTSEFSRVVGDSGVTAMDCVVLVGLA